MKEVFLRNRGAALTAIDEDGETALRSYPIGAVLRVKLTQPRSLPHHNFFFAFLEEVYLGWPFETHPFQPDDSEHLRAWLTVKAGYMQMMEFEVPDGPTVSAAIKVAKGVVFQFSGGRPIWFKVVGHKIFAAWPKSIKFTKMDEKEFIEFTTKVFDLIWSEVGIDVEEHYREWQNKNGSLQVVPARSAEKPDGQSAGLYFS